MDYKSFVNAVRNLPTPSPVLLKIENVLKQPESTAAEITEAIRLDPAITSKVLRLVNSAYIGVPRTITSLQNAVVLLGSKRVHSIVFASELLNSIAGKTTKIFKLDKYWLHSVTVALIGETLALQVKRNTGIDENEVFTAALLHDIGKLVLSQLMPDTIEEAYKKSVEDRIPYWEAENRELDHLNAGKFLGEHWSFPPLISESIFKHHEPQNSELFPLVVSIVHIADVIAHVIGRSVIDDEIAPKVSPFALEKVALSSEMFKVVAARALSDSRKVDSLLEMFSASLSSSDQTN